MEPDLIAAYLVELRRALRGRPDADDVLAELEDHLRLRVERLETDGAAPVQAQRQALEQFGDSATVARAFARVPAVTATAPSWLTRLAGLVAIAAGLGWLNLVGLLLLEQGGAPVRAGAVGGVGLTALALAGLVHRAGGFRTAWSAAAFWCLAGTALLLASTTRTIGSALHEYLLGAVTLLTVVALRGSRSRMFGRGVWSVLFQGAWLPWMAVSTALIWSQLWVSGLLVDTIDVHAWVYEADGHYPRPGWIVAAFTSLGLGLAVYAGGLIRHGVVLCRDVLDLPDAGRPGQTPTAQ